jgi:uncharacterized membrane protein YheB (UPF0754 family)
MLPISEALWALPDFWVILALPFLGAAIGGVSNWLSQRLLFGPLVAGGQDHSMLVSRAGSVAGRIAIILAPWCRFSELFRLMQPEKVAGHVSSAVVARLDEYVDDVMSNRHAVLWSNLPQALRQRIYARVGRQLPSIVDNLMEDLAENVEELVDMSQLLDAFVASNPRALPALLKQVLEEECRFLQRAAIWTGFGLGVVQCILWLYFPQAWAIIIFCSAVAVGALLLPQVLLVSGWPGAGSNLSPWLLADKARLTQSLSRGLAREVLGLRHLMQRVMNGGRAARARSMIRRHMRPLLDASLVRTTLQMLLGAEGYAHIKHQVVEKAVVSTAEILSDAEFNQGRASAMQAACDERIAALPAQELRSLVQVVLDEGLYIRVGLVAGLGAIAGVMELLLAHALRG